MIPPDRALRACLVALGVIVLLSQSYYLFCYPVPDTGMWFGDESWTMLTLRALAHDGVARVPEALGSSLAHSNGMVNGSVWVSGLLYGVPANLLRSFASPVGIGRAISLLLSIGILAVCYRTCRVLGVSLEAALLALFLFVITDLFYFSSHSARLDTITGFAVLLYLLFLLTVYDGSSKKSTANWSFFLFTFFAAISLSVYVHVPTLIALPCLFACWRLGAFRSAVSLGFAALGAAAGMLLVFALYWLSVGNISLLGQGYNQYYNVAHSLPILHPFSWQVQKINTIDRLIQVWSIAAPLVVSLIVGGIALMAIDKGQLTIGQKFYTQLAALVLVGWVLSEGPAIYYNIHAAPVVVVCVAVLLDRVLIHWRTPVGQWSMIAIILLLGTLAIRRSRTIGDVGKELATANSLAIASLVGPTYHQHPLILTDQPAMNQISGDTAVRLMTNHFLLFGEENLPMADIVRKSGVQYLLLYSTSKWQSPFRPIADSLYTLVGERRGWLTDQARSYDDPDWEHLDTLRLYKSR